MAWLQSSRSEEIGTKMEYTPNWRLEKERKANIIKDKPDDTEPTTLRRNRALLIPFFPLAFVALILDSGLKVGKHLLPAANRFARSALELGYLGSAYFWRTCHSIAAILENTLLSRFVQSFTTLVFDVLIFDLLDDLRDLYLFTGKVYSLIPAVKPLITMINRNLERIWSNVYVGCTVDYTIACGAAMLSGLRSLATILKPLSFNFGEQLRCIASISKRGLVYTEQAARFAQQLVQSYLEPMWPMMVKCIQMLANMGMQFSAQIPRLAKEAYEEIQPVLLTWKDRIAVTADEVIQFLGNSMINWMKSVKSKQE
ncbi:hypothetical protein K493DRAFT_406704 [Basidiobolus meristosporus CBS 931.73]|uniref:Uncharacterized protein n=1 Tax=Basidiobolus meristosporus CBS 931.73 TaxID=1314790 RepID=A0A1Y1YJC6_9FUNG|nr:hypothetical protein K493DRAFT_406704 [Basidiobolus meristosporus CBS 931.73]|eukprot:ORX98099.1 hypothetical protein K493DRAFT_406704 [Basidiobolus meristosporus CBS 931.73]